MLWGWYWYYLHFTVEETEAQGVQEICPALKGFQTWAIWFQKAGLNCHSTSSNFSKVYLLFPYLFIFFIIYLFISFPCIVGCVLVFRLSWTASSLLTRPAFLVLISMKKDRRIFSSKSSAFKRKVLARGRTRTSNSGPPGSGHWAHCIPA